MSAPHDLIAGRYRLVRLIAAGGMGVVWEAWDELLERPVAVKQLRTQDGVTEAEAEMAKNRAMREARITARLHHPNAVPVFDAVEHDGRPCLIMQFLPSRPLSAVLRDDGPLSPRNAARVGAQIAAALAAAHHLGIVHRDVKPGNVLIAEDGTALISDFGISHALGDATLTSTGLVHGTPAFLAPEVARGDESSFASDVFSLGSTLYAAVEGSPPFGQDSNSIAVLHKVALAQFLAPTHSGPLTPLLLDMLDVHPHARPDMAEVAARLRALDADAEEPPTMPLVAAGTEEPRTAVLPEVVADAAAEADVTPVVPLEPAPAADALEGEAEAEPEGEAEAEPAEGEAGPGAEEEEEPDLEAPDEDEGRRGILPGVAGVAAAAAGSATADAAEAQPVPAGGSAPPEPVAEEDPVVQDEPVEEAEADEVARAGALPGELDQDESGSADAGVRESLARRVRAAFAADAPAGAVALASPPAVATADPATRDAPATQPEVLASPAAPFAPPPESPTTGGSPPPERRDRRRLLIPLLVLAALVIAVLLALALLPAALAPAPTHSAAPPVHPSKSASVTPSASPSPSPSPSTTPSPAPSPSPSPTAAPSNPAPRPASSAPAAAGPPTASQLASAIISYYALLPNNTDAAWNRLTPRFQAGKAGPRSYFESFWGGFSSVTASDVSGSAPDTATATIRYVANDGTVTVERDTYRLVRQDGVLKIDSQTTG